MTTLLAVTASIQNLSAAESYQLSAGSAVDAVQQVKVQLSLQGKLKLNPDGKKVITVPMSGEARIEYDERLFAQQNALRAVRHYHTAQADISIDKTQLHPRLSSERKMLGFYWSQERPLLSGINNQLTSEELDLVDVPGNSALLQSLLPEEPKQIGDEWQHTEQVLAPLLGLEAVSQTTVKSKLVEVNGSQAQIDMAGTVSGASGGVSSEIELKASYSVDIQSRRINRLALAIREDRSISHAKPGFEVVAQLRLAIQTLPQSNYLTDAIVSGVPRDVSAATSLLSFTSEKGGFSLLHDRNWQIMIDQPHITIIRLVDKGDLIAQCNVSRLADQPPGKHLELEAFQSDVQKSLGDRFGQLVEANQSTTPEGLRVLRVVAAGAVSDLSVQWIYYHVANEQGQRVSYLFTMESKYIERFAGIDGQLVGAIQFIGAASQTAQQQVDAPAVR